MHISKATTLVLLYTVVAYSIKTALIIHIKDDVCTIEKIAHGSQYLIQLSNKSYNLNTERENAIKCKIHSFKLLGRNNLATPYFINLVTFNRLHSCTSLRCFRGP